MKDLFDKNFKFLKRGIKEDIRRWKDLPHTWISRINIGKNGHPTLSNPQFHCNSHQNSNTILHRSLKDNFQLHKEAHKKIGIKSHTYGYLMFGNETRNTH